MRTRRQAIEFIALSGAFFAAPKVAFAHRFPETQTEINWRPKQRALDVSHMYHLHDIESALAGSGVISSQGISGLKDRAAAALYTSRTFGLSLPDSTPIELDIIGAEIVEGRFYVYQNATLETRPEGLSVNPKMLRSLISGQKNTVHVNLSGEIKSIQFSGQDEAKIILA